MQSLGTMVYWLGETIIAQVTVKPGETEWDRLYTARKELEMLDRDKLPYLYHAKPKFYPLGT